MGFLADWFTSVFLIKLDFQLGLMVCSCTIKNGMVEREDSQPETSLDYMVRPCLKIKQNHKNLNIVRKCVDKPYKRDSLKMNKVVPSGYSLLGRKWQSLWWGNLIEKNGILLACYLPFDEAIPLLGIQESELVNALPLLHNMHCCPKDGQQRMGYQPQD